MLPTKLGVARRPLTSNVLVHARGPCNAPIRFSSTSSTPSEPLALGSHRGTVPFHETLAIVHTDIPPTNWPSKVQPILPLYPELQAYARNFHGIVNIAYFPSTSSRAALKTFPSTPSSSPDSPLHLTRSPGNPAWPTAEECSHPVTLFAGGNKVIEFPRVRLQDAEKVYHDLYGGLLDGVPVSGLGAIVRTPINNYGVSHIFVCTHAARDCRCGTTGVEVFNAISNAVAGHPAWSRLGIQMGQVAHVGGHKWAANVLVYPRGDWYRQVKVENIPGLLEDIMREDWAAHAPSNDYWAGRMGLSSLGQKARIQAGFTASTKSQ